MCVSDRLRLEERIVLRRNRDDRDCIDVAREKASSCVTIIGNRARFYDNNPTPRYGHRSFHVELALHPPMGNFVAIFIHILSRQSTATPPNPSRVEDSGTSLSDFRR